MDILLISFGVLSGFTLCWFTKDSVIAALTGTENLVTRLETQVKMLRAML